jgi:triacylglycerol esterase/lipase EstA (alpha/beta hydrolase family)
VKARNILDSIRITAFIKPLLYGSLRQFLITDIGYDRSEVFTVGVDWRQSVSRLADDLNRKLQDIRSRTGAKDLDLIAHSHGGLVVRAYLAKFPQERVARFISVAVPHKGMFKTFDALVEGIEFLGFSRSQPHGDGTDVSFRL